MGSLHWPSAGADLGPGGISNVELLILYELWAGERFQFDKAVPRCQRVDRPISVSAVPFGPGIDIRRSCRFIGSLIVSFLVQRCVRYVLCLVASAGFSLVLLVPTTAGYRILVGINLVMVSPPGLVRLPVLSS